MSIDIGHFHQAFFEEAGERLATLESALLALDPERADDEAVNALFRDAHSIKGGAGTFGFSDIRDLTHLLESLLDRVRKGKTRLTREWIDLCLETGDVLAAMVAAHQEGRPPEAAPIERVSGLLGQALAEDTAMPGPAGSARAPAAPARAEAEDGFGFFSDAPGAPESTAPQDAGEEPDWGLFESAPAAAEAKADPATCAAAPAVANPARAAQSAPRSEGGSIRVGVDKVDQLLNLVGELVITQAMLAQSGTALDPVAHERLLGGLAALERNSRDLQEAVMSIRMLPISTVFNRFPRVLRDLCDRLGKKANLRLSGEGTELDRGLIERITDPLMHLVRNSLDHGIESPEAREAQGKSPAGTITLTAGHQGGNIVIEVGDDGQGLARERILAKAASCGMVAHESMSDQEVWQLIFEPGFSTAEQVTDVSGRGVGMDVVKKNIHALGGRVELHSTPGKGTKVTVRLPLTLAILDGMLVGVGSEIFIVPLNAVVESMQPAAGAMRPVQGRGQTIRVRGEYLPILALSEVFGLKAATRSPVEGILVVVEADGLHTALLVDGLVGQQQVVIKSLEQNYRRVAGISGATIMGDGRVALILDVGALVGMTRGHREAA